MQDPEVSPFRESLEIRRSRLHEALHRNRGAADLERLLAEVDAALARLENGSFGLCQACGEPVEAERLLADPLTCYCLDHLTVEQYRALEQDLELAAKVQGRLLPPRQVAAGCWEIVHYFRAAGPVSGDYLDLIRSRDREEEVYVFLGDVSGKGVAASLLMSHLHAVFRSLIPGGGALSHMVGRANHVFRESSLASQYATLISAHLGAEGQVELCNAGHCLPYRLNGGGVRPVECTGLPLGLFAESTFESCRLSLSPGERLFLYTDGLVEAHDRGHREYGSQRLEGVLAQSTSRNSREVLEHILEDHSRFLGGLPLHDDLAVMIVERTR